MFNKFTKGQEVSTSYRINRRPFVIINIRQRNTAAKLSVIEYQLSEFNEFYGKYIDLSQWYDEDYLVLSQKLDPNDILKGML